MEHHQKRGAMKLRRSFSSGRRLRLCVRALVWSLVVFSLCTLGFVIAKIAGWSSNNDSITSGDTQTIGWISGESLMIINITREGTSRAEKDTQEEKIRSAIKKTTPKYEELPLDQINTTQVLILSYQRCGSTFVADMLFDHNPEAFYVYEPLDAVYTFMYGVEPGYSVPSSIYITSDGQHRDYPTSELESTTQVLDKMFRRDITTLPPLWYIHPFWSKYGEGESTNCLADFVKCVSDGRVRFFVSKLARCQVMARDVCGKRLEDNVAGQEACHRYMWLDDDMSLSRLQKNKIDRYQACSDAVVRLANVGSCRKKHMEPLKSARLDVTAVKTVRATMRHAEELLSRFPRLKVVHLFRHPLSVVASRQEYSDWTRGVYEQDGSDRKTAHVYCSILLKDYMHRKTLEHKYPGRIMELRYENVVKYSTAAVKAVYDFLQVPIPQQMAKEVGQIQVKIKPIKDNKDVLKACNDLLQEVNFSES